MKGGKKGWFLPLTFIMLFVCISGRATDDSDDGKEEDVLALKRCYERTVKSKKVIMKRIKENNHDLSVVPGAPLPPLKLGHSICALKADEGPCKAIHMRYYFNVQSRECEIFEYGGCHGNENNFLTLEECQNKCVVTEMSLKMMLAKMKQEKPDFCFHEKDPGTCRGFFSRYFYNKETKLCEIFKYGGCLGNQNNFKSLEECQTTCQGNSNLLPDSPTEDHPNPMNSRSPEEEHNQFPRIFVNLLPTAPNEEKSNIMNSSYPEEEHKQFPRFFEPPAIPSLCMTPMDKGLCRAKETRFFYNYSTGRCRPFNYSGCGGNENNFTSRKSCLRICKKGFIKNKGERRVIKIKKKKKKMSVKALEEESIPERIQL